MGRIKTQLTKRVGAELVGRHSEQLSKNFAENKQRIAGLAEIRSKKLKNTIAGYVTRLKNKKV